MVGVFPACAGVKSGGEEEEGIACRIPRVRGG